jgi:dihydrofolate synthase/folylpolyglutamate synthase
MLVPRFASLAQWLRWQETLHPQAIDLGLERVRTVAQRLALDKPPFTVITVGGTNGKGSCTAFLDAILRASGYAVGAYTSPHLLRYNERIRVNGITIEDDRLCQAFARVDAARNDISLTYFEFGTLAALDIFCSQHIEVAVLEVGLGGRLDAVNLLDADAAVVTSVDIDHSEWLGPDRESIGYEKAGIFRRNRAAICADPMPPTSLLSQARTLGARLYQVNSDYGFRRNTENWSWWYGNNRLQPLPLPSLSGDHQLGNAAAALMALTVLQTSLPVDAAAVCQGLTKAYLPGRFQIIPGPVEWILDVAHNAHGANALAHTLAARPCGGITRAVLGMLEDKDTANVARMLDSAVHCWYTATLQGARGQSGKQLATTLKTVAVKGVITPFSSVTDACRAARQEAAAGDRILICGSFHTVAKAMLYIGCDGDQSY